MRGGLALIFRDPGRVIVLDKSGCLYNLNTREKECSCGEETGRCQHLDFASRPHGPTRCLICLHNSADSEVLCVGCHSLYHHSCLERRKPYGLSVCLNCGLEWSQSMLKLCYYCGCQVKGVGVICAFCPGLDMCLTCYQAGKHGHQAYLMEEDGLVWAPHCIPLLGYLPLLFQKYEVSKGLCCYCEDTIGSLMLLKCGHEVHVDCLIQAIQRRDIGCRVCLAPFFRGISRTIHTAKRQPVTCLRSLNYSVEYPISTPTVLHHIGVSVTPKAVPIPPDHLDTLPPLTPLKLQHFRFSGGSEPRQRPRNSIEPVQPHRQSVKRNNTKKQRDLTVLNLSFDFKNDGFERQWKKLPGRFLSRTKGIKRYMGKSEAVNSVNFE